MRSKIAIIALLLISISMTPMSYAQTYKKLWKSVEEAQQKGLPQTVVKLTEDIYRKAEKEKNSAQMLKAYTARSQYQESVTPDSFYVDLKGLETWVNETTASIDCAILHTLIANMYSEYARNNSWQLRRSTDLSEEPSDDLREWSANLFLQKVFNHSRAALEDSVPLLNISSKEYEPFIVQGELSAYFHHDMYHVIVNYVVNALKNAKLYGEDEEIYRRMLQVYDHAISAYQQRGNQDAVVIMTLNKLQELKLKNRDQDVYLQALDQLIQTYKANESIVQAYISKANTLLNKQDYIAALKCCNEGIENYPTSKDLDELKKIRERILAPLLTARIEQEGYPGATFKIKVNHQNIDKFIVNIYRSTVYPADGEDAKDITPDELRERSSGKITHEFNLIRPADYLAKDSTFTLPVPEEGLYYVEILPVGIESQDPKEQKIFPFVSTRLEVISRVLPDGQLEMAAVDGQSGYPIAGVTLLLFNNEKNVKTVAETLTTGADGKALVMFQNGYYYFIAKKDKDSSVYPKYLWRNYYSEPDKATILTLLTDRSVYRPGQTVHVKGIAYEQYLDAAKVVKDKAYKVSLFDSTHRVVGTQTVRSNDFGSFATEFILPSGGLNGAYYIETKNATAVIYMEEYKRPTFEITFDAPQGSFRLGDAVEVSGKVKTYSGIPVQEAEVKYTVNRALNVWPFYVNAPQLIASGTSHLDETGTFKVPVELVPDASETPNLLRYKSYVYTIEAVVTNEVGETQTSLITLNAGERSLRLDMSLEPGKIVNKEEPIQTIFRVENLNGQPVSVEGTYEMYSYMVYTDDKKNVSPTVVNKGTFTSNQTMNLTAWQKLPSGAYQIKARVTDTQGREVEHEQDIILFSTNDQRLPIPKNSWIYEQNTQFDKENPGVFVFGTSLQDTYIFMDAFCGKRKIKSEVLRLSDEMKRFEFPFESKEYDQGVSVIFAFVKNGQFYQETVNLTKRVTNKKLDISWETFRDKLRPGQKEEWKLTIKDQQGMAASAELLALMYDASLDQIRQNNQQLEVAYNFYPASPQWRMYSTRSTWQSYGSVAYKMGLVSKLNQKYDAFWMYAAGDKIEFSAGWGQTGMTGSTRSIRIRGTSSLPSDALLEEGSFINFAGNGEDLSQKIGASMRKTAALKKDGSVEQAPDIRTNFAETAFFYPQLRTNEKGEIVFSFTMPESLTRWNFRGYAHTPNMLTGMINGVVTTSKDFMVTPNLPRFVRVGDQTSIAASIANLTEKAISGTVTLTLFDPMTDKVISTQQQKFNTQAGEAIGVNFTFSATDKYELLGCRIVAKGGNFSDGEQHVLPVLSNKEYVTETVAMPIRGKETRNFSLESLFNNQSKTATERKLTVEFTGNPAWYAVQALPSLSLPTNDNAISWAAAYYTNSLASYLANAQPKIKTVFDAWKVQGGTKETFLSNLEKNQDVKNILLEESPWLLEATSEAEQMKRVATLFDLNNIQNNNITALTKLKDLQLVDGSWTWYKGMQGSRYITSYIVETLARLSKLTGNALEGDALNMQQNAFSFLHQDALNEYKNIKKVEKNGNRTKGISATALDYLYLLAISNQQVPENNQEAYTYYINKVKESIADLSITGKAHAAIVLAKAGKADEAQLFIASLKEYAVQTDELGMYFAFNESPYSWQGLKVPAHVAVMEALDEVAKDTRSVEEMKLWLLKQKQTQQWDSPVSTTSAVYALLYRGNDLLANRGDVRISLGKKTIGTLSINGTTIPGLSYVKEVITDHATLAGAKTAVVEKRDEGMAWGAVYAQYKEDIDKVATSGGELSVDKKLYVERISGTTKELVPVTAGTILNIGDKVISRLTIRLDRAMDFVQLKDQRGACFEPIGTTSGYRWGAGTGYYVAIKDASTNFFFDSLSKGVYVLEYGYRVSRTGTYESGLATIQSAYAPEYAAHGASVKVHVK